MRHIALLKNKPDADWIKKAEGLLEQLKAAPNKAARDELIDKKSKLWGELKDWLLAMSHEKCWFSEAKDVFNYWHVEHFRPKKSAKDLDGTEHQGYWWLAFDWKNYRICGSVGNGKKGTFFPLRDGCIRIGIEGDERLEDHVLLDPIDPHDPSLLSFDFEGNAIPDPELNDEWDVFRVTYSIDRYKLDYGPLERKRKTLWTECWGRIEQYLVEIENYQKDKTNDYARRGVKDAANRIREMIRETEEFSSVAKACIFSSGDKRVTSLLRT